MELCLDFLFHCHFLWGGGSWIIILLLIFLSGRLNGRHGIIVFLDMMISVSMVLLEVLTTKHLVLSSHIVIMKTLVVHKSTALDEVIRLLLIIVLEVACHI